jgi:hypothetical protein
MDVIGGMYATAPDGTVAVARFDPKGRPAKTRETDFFMEDSVVEVFGLGFGFVAMKSGVFESTDRPWFKIEQMQWDDVPFTVKVLHHKDTIYELP